jgi:poly(hydroxyalkanoate) granule-associated protein
MSPTKKTAEVPADVLEAAQRIWFAGLGAMVLAQEEGLRVVDGTAKLFSVLVDKGEEMEKSRPSPLAQTRNVVGKAEEAWARIQKLVDAQVTAALHRLGVPTKDEIGVLSKRIEELTASIEALKAQA